MILDLFPCIKAIPEGHHPLCEVKVGCDTPTPTLVFTHVIKIGLKFISS